MPVFPIPRSFPAKTRSRGLPVDKEYGMSSSVLEAPRSIPKALGRRNIEIVRMSAIRQLKTRYRGTFLGVFWSFANPILMTGLYAILFGTAFSSYYGGSVLRYIFSVFVAVVVVTFFSQSTAEALTAVVSNGGLLNKIAVDPETFPVASIAANAFQHAITTFPLIMILTAAITHDPVRIVLAPIVLAALILLVAGCGLALSALFVFFRDLSHLWGVISFIFWMTSPVFYPASLVPERVRPWFEINPVGLAIAALRNVALGTGPIDVVLLAKFIVVALIFALGGHLIFRAKRNTFMDLL
jgi:lipopolysaccharide transport system permease protein